MFAETIVYTLLKSLKIVVAMLFVIVGISVYKKTEYILVRRVLLLMMAKLPFVSVTR
jgi:hypothetical protein